MVNTRGNKHTDPSGEGETSHPMAEPIADHHFKGNAEVFVQKADDKRPKEHLSQEETEKLIVECNYVEKNEVFVQEVDDKGPKAFLSQEESEKNEIILLMQTDNENKIESDQNISEDDKKNDRENLSRDDDEEDLSEEEEEDNEDSVGDRDGNSDEDSRNEVAGDDEVSADEALEDDSKVDEVGRDMVTGAVKSKKKEAKAKEDKKEPKISCNQRESKAIENKRIAKAKEGEKKAKVNEDEMGAKVEMNGKKSNDKRNDKQVEGLKNTKGSDKRSKKKKVQLGMSSKMGPNDKAGSLKKRKGKKRVESMGMIFMCSSKTKKDCYKYRVLGLPESKKDVVENIYIGMRLFLYDIDLKLLYGIYKAMGPGGYNIQPKAFKSQFPAQVRFTVLDDCLPLPEEKFKKVIRENYFTSTKFDCLLTGDQVKKLCKLFVVSSKGHTPQKLVGSRRSEKNPHPLRQERSKKRVRLGEDLRDKRPRKAVDGSPLGYAYDQTTSDVDGHRRIPYPYRIAREPPTPTVIRRDSYVDGWDSYYRDELAPRPPSYMERRDPYGELGLRGSYREGRSLYLDPSRDAAYAEHSSWRARPLSDIRDGFRESLYLDAESRYRPHIGSRDSFVSALHVPLYDDPTYSAPRAGLSQEYYYYL